MRSRDTSPEAWQVFIELQRQMSPSEKLRRTLDYSDSMRRATAAGLRQRYPQASEREIFLRLAQITLGDELAEKVYGTVPYGRTGRHP